MPGDETRKNEPLFFMYQEITEKLEKVIEGQTNLSIRMEAVERQVGELNRTVRGSNGTPGLVTDVAIVKESVREIKNQGNEKDDPFISWRWIVDKGFTPVVIALVLWFLMTFLPHVISQLGVPGGG